MTIPDYSENNLSMTQFGALERDECAAMSKLIDQKLILHLIFKQVKHTLPRFRPFQCFSVSSLWPQQIPHVPCPPEPGTALAPAGRQARSTTLALRPFGARFGCDRSSQRDWSTGMRFVFLIDAILKQAIG